MDNDHRSMVSRRGFLRSAALIGSAVGLAADAAPGATAASSKRMIASSPIMRAIPATHERLPAVGVGANAFRNANYNEVRDLLRRMVELGGSVVDTAAAYGESEAVIGKALEELGLRDKLFLATKFGESELAAAKNSFERSRLSLRTTAVDLLQIHSLQGLELLMPLMQEYKAAGKIRYLGVTTSREEQHPALLAALQKYALDFVQVDYSLANRAAAQSVLPAALERGVAVLINMPLGGRRASLMQDLGGRQLPAWAEDIDAASWSQFFLKYVIGHPAVTCAIPGSTMLAHLEDNQLAARGRLPDAPLRLRMEKFWDAKT